MSENPGQAACFAPRRSALRGSNLNASFAAACPPVLLQPKASIAAAEHPPLVGRGATPPRPFRPWSPAGGRRLLAWEPPPRWSGVSGPPAAVDAWLLFGRPADLLTRPAAGLGGCGRGLLQRRNPCWLFIRPPAKGGAPARWVRQWTSVRQPRQRREPPLRADKPAAMDRDAWPVILASSFPICARWGGDSRKRKEATMLPVVRKWPRRVDGGIGYG